MNGDRVAAGRFVIEAPLGKGGMGRVWRARDRELDRTVALKQIRPEVGPVPELVERAKREARALARIDHPGIVKVHDFLDTRDGPWIVMDHVSGDALGTLIGRSPLPELEVARIGAQVLDALRAAHAVDVYHRDVKPDNILITASGKVVLVDFGIAVIEGQSSITTLGRVVGTLDYMAPERLSQMPAEAAADLWSLGATLYTALEGRPPFRRTNEVAVKFAILRAEPDRMLRPGRLAPTIARLLDKNPDTRMDAAELARALAHLLAPPHPSGHTPPPSGFSGPSGSPGSSGKDRREGVRRGVPFRQGPVREKAWRPIEVQGEKLLALPAAVAATLLGERWHELTADAVEEMCGQAPQSAKILQMLLPGRACRLLDQVRDPALVAGVVLAMDARHRGQILGGMHDRNAAAAVGAMATTDPRATGLAVAAMPEGAAVRALNRLPSTTIADVLTHCPDLTRHRLLARLPDPTREATERRLTG
ncbi:serine/threonine-protein kinase [Nonomuraea maritima]|uniref:serine/threonine-protein kinase n=1 Tax=Nonomuraea maritima TaxID=683260 RepID=UPI00371F9893